MTARFIVGDTRDVIETIPDGSVDLVLTSPPFLALRSYLPNDHPDKHREIGSEESPAAFLDVLLDLVVEWRRVLAPHGSICIELGDTYAGHDNRGSSSDPGKHNAKVQSVTTGRGWPMAKSLTGIPHLFHLSLAYGRNLLNGREIEPWRVRNVIAWCRPNPPVGALGDKFRPATSYMTIATIAKDRYFDLDAVRVPFTGHAGVGTGVRKGQNGAKPEDNRPDDMPTRMNTHDGAPPLDWWKISTQPFAGAHYATWPEALCERPIKAMVPTKVCTTCGEPSRRIVAQSMDIEDPDDADYLAARAAARHGERLGMGSTGRQHVEPRRILPTGEWSDCGHGTWRPGLVLDPFAGSGTTLAVAVGHGRAAIGIDIDERNVDLARERVGPMFFDVEHFDEEVLSA